MIGELEARPEQIDTGTGPASDISVVIIDGHDVVHAGIATWCAQAQPPITVAGAFHSPMAFLAHQPNLPDEADVILLGLYADGGRPPFDMVHRLCQAGRKVIVYSQLSSHEVILTCLELGAVSYLVKTEGRRHLIEAIRAAHSDVPYLGPQMAKALLHERNSGRLNLSEREKQVLTTWFQTDSKELVAERLYIAPTTVRTHLQRARAKYAATGRPATTKAALLARAVEDGILSLGEL